MMKTIRCRCRRVLPIAHRCTKCGMETRVVMSNEEPPKSVRRYVERNEEELETTSLAPQGEKRKRNAV